MPIVPLQKPVEWHGTQLAQLELREPTGADYFGCGEPFVIVRNPAAGSYYLVDQDEVIQKYLDRLLKIDGGAAILGALSFADARALKKAVIDFFTDAPEATSA